MKNYFLIIFFGVFLTTLTAQRKNLNSAEGQLFKSDSTTFQEEITVKLSGTTKYTDYKVISVINDTTVIDTTLTLAKYFKFNYLRKDDFELLPFHNQGQTFSKLGYNFSNSSLIPSIGASSKQYNYYKIEDVFYYNVPTPTSEVMYRTGLEQGQVLDAFLTMNTSPQTNFSAAYKGLRSLGKYRYSLSSHGNFRTSFNYHSKNNTYAIRGHFSSFDLTNNENGGLTEESIGYFEANDPNYIDRGRLEVNYIDAETIFDGKRYYIDQKVTLISNQIYEPKIKSPKKSDKVSAKTKPVKGEIPLKTEVKDSISTVKDSLVVISDVKIKKDSLLVNEVLKNIDSPKKSDKVSAKTKPVKGEIPLKTEAKDSISIVKDSLVVISDVKIKKNSLLVNEVFKNIDSSKISAKKSPYAGLKLGHTFMYETQHYRFKQGAVNEIFGNSFSKSITDHSAYKVMDNLVYLELQAPLIGVLRAKANQLNYNYQYNSILYLNTQTISDKLKGDVLSVGADWNTKFGNFKLNVDATTIISGELSGSSYKSDVSYKKDSIFSFKGFAEVTSKSPDFNKLLFQSDYLNYNWQNNFKNEEIKIVGAGFSLFNWGGVEASYTLVDNYTYFNENSQPIQANETLSYLKAKLNASISYGKFTLENTVMYQKVIDSVSFFNVPELVTRNTIYYANHIFKGKPLYLQTGVTFKYFTAFNANAYNPLLSEFIVQNTDKIGNYPIFDFFVNAQIKRTRIYLKVENFTASFTGRNYYSAPNYPYRDLTVRFGLVWNWFI
ncbi:putative porin [Lutibacter sp.]|uniref:putative porin n=1 Tax=Lutibacter sp. TaxID=1925666 RepID=UPI002736FC81|nr:putative porin [Lutibacter sp.]MDP3314301.1 putative porin [Lutibacter sp.]